MKTKTSLHLYFKKQQNTYSNGSCTISNDDKPTIAANVGRTYKISMTGLNLVLFHNIQNTSHLSIALLKTRNSEVHCVKAKFKFALVTLFNQKNENTTSMKSKYLDKLLSIGMVSILEFFVIQGIPCTCSNTKCIEYYISAPQRQTSNTSIRQTNKKKQNKLSKEKQQSTHTQARTRILPFAVGVCSLRSINIRKRETQPCK